ncbi:MAG: hypothetical protein ACR2OU_03950 [Thermomicrobiales bacterium]
MTLSWQAGSAIAPFPTAHGTPLGGYLDRAGPASDTLDELEIGAFVLRCANRQLAIVTADVVGVDTALATAIAATSGIPKDDLLLSASHTHSGPRAIVERLHPADPGMLDPDLRARFVAIAGEVLARATERCEPVTLDICEWPVRNAWTNRNDPHGPNDARIRLATARRPDRSLQTAIALIACHPTILGASSTMVSADLIGGIRRSLADVLAREGAPANVLSLTGAAGDISTRFTRQESTAAEIDRLGKLATTGLPDALATAREIAPSLSSLTTHRVTCTLPSALAAPGGFNPEETMRLAERQLQDLDANGGSEAERRQAITRRQGAYLRSLLPNMPSAYFQIELSGWRIGDTVALLDVPGELFTSLGTTIEHESPFATTWVAGYGNGYVGYIADRIAYDSLTYEAMASPFAPDAGAIVTSAANHLLASMFAH